MKDLCVPAPSRPPMFKPHQLFIAFIALTLCLMVSFSICNATLAQAISGAGVEERDRGIALYNQGRVKEAISAIETAIKKENTDYRSWYFLGLAQIKRESFKDASLSLHNALQLQPRFAPGHSARAYAALKQNQLFFALSEAELALRLDSTVNEAHYILGVINLRKRDTEQALKEAEAMINLNPAVTEAYLLKSQALVGGSNWPQEESTETRNSRYLEAAKSLEKYLELVPNAEHRQSWLEQLDALRFHVSSQTEASGAHRVYNIKEVTTKAQVLAKPAPSYSEEARQLGVTGTVVLRCIVAFDGTIKHFLVVSGLPNGLTESALESARKLKFSPATINGKPVSVVIQLEYNFLLS